MMPFGSEGGSHSTTTVLPDVDDSLGGDKRRGPAKSVQKQSANDLKDEIQSNLK